MNILDLFSSKQIKVATLGSLGIKFLSTFFAFLNGILLARVLSVKEFGAYVLAFATINLIVIPVSFGLPNLITRYISKYQVEKDFAGIKGLLIRSNQLVLLTTALALLLAYVTYLVWWGQYEMSTTMWYAFLILPFLALGSIRSAALRGLKLVVLGQLPDTFIRNFLLFVGLIVFYLAGNTLTPENAMLIHAIAAAIAFIVGSLFLKSKLLNKLKGIRPSFSEKEWTKATIPFLINGGTQTLKEKSITYLLAIFGSLEAVAIFDVAMRGAALVSFALGAINSAIPPYISTAFEQKNMESLQRIVTKANRLVFAFSVVVVIVFVVGGEALLTFMFGNEYAVSFIPLLILCLGQLVHALAGSAGPVLNMTGNQAYLSKNLIQMLILNVGLSIALIIFFDVLGASWAYTITLIVQNIILVRYIQKKLGVNTTIFS
ncbi:oligosaccharide flippase family protein [Aureisphaera galaxeae]|uniref:oligosaccharide flippase family protein n=1 Tax=Aureisphaera galaxeae TaxID=1538023 RepID=UPI00234FCD3B|nr:oligosaccharide flippase family protein [Aureisphaera galaxeae]MDC8004595.1 oligosaccharide flippase family protein [Aureisphaera galaxeae]